MCKGCGGLGSKKVSICMGLVQEVDILSFSDAVPVYLITQIFICFMSSSILPPHFCFYFFLQAFKVCTWCAKFKLCHTESLLPHLFPVNAFAF